MDLITTASALLVGKKLLGKTMDVVSEDIANIYASGRDKIIESAARKVKNIDDNARANLRVSRDVFWNGAYTDEAICAEYFGGILASSRSADGKDDRGIYYADIIKSLSSQQLHLHYVVYRALNLLWIGMPDEKKRPDVAMAPELQDYTAWFATNEIERFGISVEKDMIALANKGLISDRFKADAHALEEGGNFFYVHAQPSILGVQLYAVAHNRLSDWRELSLKDFGEFPDIKFPEYFGLSLEELLKKLNLK